MSSGLTLLQSAFGAIVLVALPVRAFLRLRRNAPPTAAGAYVVETLFLTLLLIFILRLSGVPIEAVGLRNEAWPWLCVKCALAVSLVVGLDLLVLWYVRCVLRDKIVVTAGNDSAIERFTGEVPQRKELASFAAVCVVGAIWEELCFRGIGLGLAPRTMVGLAAFVVVSSFFFALQHLRRGVAAAAYSGFYGLLFSVLYLAMGNLLPVIVAHAFGNFGVALRRSAPIIREDQPEIPMFF